MNIDLYTKHLLSVAIGVAIFSVSWIGLLLVRRLVWKRLVASALKTPRQWDDALLVALSRPIHVLSFFIAVSAGLHLVPTGIQNLPSLVQGTKLVLLLLLAWIVDRVAGIMVRYGQFPGSVGVGGRSLILTLIRCAFFSIIFLIVLDTLGISITPLLASLGVGSVAVALALQDTLGNLFSGMYVLIDRPIRVGDYVKLDQGVEGFVRKIGWRSTRLELLTNNLVIIPNTKISSAILTNYNMPVDACIVSVEASVAYGSDLARVENVVLEVSTALQQQWPFAVCDHVPVVRFHAFGDSGVVFKVALKARTYSDQFLLKHEFIKAMHSRFLVEGLDIPFPQRVVHTVNAKQ